MARMLVHCANYGDAPCGVAVVDVCSVTLNCAMASFVERSNTNAAVVRASHGTIHGGHGVAEMICRPNMRVNPHGECIVDVCCVPNRQFHAYAADIQCLLPYRLYDECHHMILSNVRDFFGAEISLMHEN